MRSPLTRDRLCLTLWGLTALFALRVAAQPLALVVPSLPAFDTWHGNVMPYRLLLASQLLILGIMVTVNRACMREQPSPRPRLAPTLKVLGWIYFSAMMLRLSLGLGMDHAPLWFDRPLPTFFHLILATWLLLLARRLSEHAR